MYQQEKLDADGFAEFYTPLEERRKQLEMALPKLQAEVDVLKVDSISAEEIASQAKNLCDHWQSMQPDENGKSLKLSPKRL